jgi:hypothetical protein
MDLIGLAAIVGAAAWVPQIVRWVYKYISKPKLEILSAPIVAISYTAVGPIIQWATSISTQKQDALITKMVVRITHEKGENRLLAWSAINELFSEVSGLAGEHAQFRKPQSVLAIKATTETLTERTITFYDKDFYSSAEKEIAVAKQHYHYLKTQDGDASETLVKTKEFRQSLEFFSKDTFWREGKYRLDVSLFEKHLKTPHKQAFGVYVTKDHVEKLRNNLDAFDPYLRFEILGAELQPSWHWVYPAIISLDQ